MKVQKLFYPLFTAIILFQIPVSSFAQMVVGTDTLYGNEWINYNQSYFKIKVAKDGIYRISYDELSEAGVFSGSDIPKGNQLSLFRLGEDIPIFTSTSGTFENEDYFEFYGLKNRGEVDVFLYEDPSYQINPEYSIFSDTAIYFLTWSQSTDNLRMNEIANDLSNPPDQEEYCTVKTKLSYQNKLSLGRFFSGSADVSAEYDLGEGYCKNTNSSDQSFAIRSSESHNTGDAIVQVRLQVRTGQHELELFLNDSSYLVDSFSNWAVKDYSFSVPVEKLLNSSQLRITGNSSDSDKFQVSNISLKYPHNFSFENKNYFEFDIEGNGRPQYLEISKFKFGSDEPVLYDLTTGHRIVCTIDNNLVKVVIPAFFGNRKLVLKSKLSEKKAIISERVSFTNFLNLNGDYIILSNSKLFDDGTGKNYVQEYADYRSSMEGGGYSSVVVDVNQIYDQFGYGIDRHEQSLRNFIHWILPKWNPKMLFIIGKGVYYHKMRTSAADWEDFDMVPSFGYPSSDNLIAAGHESNISKIPVGRIAAYKPSMVRQYLKKVKELESVQMTTPQTIEDKAWMKNMLHLGGGDIDIQTLIKKELENLEDIAEESTFGANTFSLFKNSTDVVQQATSDDVIDFINSGVSLITFFGHSAPNTLDFDIGDPERYQNKGKYPFIYAMGCNTNRLFESRKTLSEEYVFVEDKGAITFIGSTATTSLSNLAVYGKEFYKKLSNELYGETIGNIMRAVIEDYPGSGFWSELVQNNIMLHGDPALRLNPHVGPDFIVNLEKTKTIPNFVNAQVDSFQIDLTVTNIGRAISDSMDILIKHELPNGDIIFADTLNIPTPKYELTFSKKIPLLGDEPLGKNKLIITLNPNTKITELPASAENNNYSELPFIVISNSAFPVYPPNFSIVNNLSELELKASTANVFSNRSKYIFQIDTTILFNSPLFQTETVQSTGGLMSWKPNLPNLNNTAFFWRVSIDSTETDGRGLNWSESSFTILENERYGWNQNSFWQKSEGSPVNQEIDTIERKINFSPFQSEFKVVNGAVGVLNLSEIALSIDGFRFVNYWPCPNNAYRDNATFWILAFDKNTHEYRNINNTGGQYNCWNNPNAVWIKGMDDLDERSEAIDFIKNYIPSEDYVVIFTTQNRTSSVMASQWAADSTALGTNIFQVLEAQGATKIRDLAIKETPYIFIFQKDNPDWDGMREIHAASINDIIQTTTVLDGRQSAGSLITSPIGPSREWNTLTWKVLDVESQDFAGVDVIGISKIGKDSLLHQNIQAKDTTLTHIDAREFPFLKLRLNTVDTLNRTSPQLDFWRVLYEPYPEFALDPNSEFQFHSDSLQEGEQLKLQLAIENVSNVKSDSLLVKFSVKDQINNEQSYFKRYRAISEGDSLIVNFETDTKGLPGENLLTIEANPNEDQQEQFHFNNIGVLEFFVEKDARNPLLDVTFDGERIVNGDIISPTPEILIELKDENRFLALNDTTGFEISILSPGQTEYSRIPIADPAIEFIPAEADNLDNNRAKIYYRPQFLEDGDYKLRVNGKDIAGNKSGSTAYEIAFKIINKSMISNMVNYPNPFSNATRFLYTLTGNEIPTNFKIQILTVSGRIVREVSQAEFGTMKIGTHLSDYVWDGTDEFGDPLANGVYLYRVTAKNTSGEDIERYDSGADQFFTRSYGKMMLIR